ncbi:MAG: hypothetical protein HN353_08170 [Bdellovibrionales bacterium]|mgnify:CR=1 FL=1|jgi:hypothetical protein|nr:hypothetical protein [Bdellovibrionales bacterium]MBT3525896.1 hypothetical protein [Bdellovibrionales bacterium]MBT7670045.1 hypothetical protein [Bdellovibrionales bacterium]MBT7765906.1 hypothetical protein [Bdellovibrionales bacterium]
MQTDSKESDKKRASEFGEVISFTHIKERIKQVQSNKVISNYFEILSFQSLMGEVNAMLEELNSSTLIRREQVNKAQLLLQELKSRIEVDSTQFSRYIHKIYKRVESKLEQLL